MWRVTTIAEFTLAAEDFPLGEMFEDNPTVTLELDRVVPSGDTVWPYFWVEDGEADFGGIRSVFTELSELRSVELLEATGDRALFRATWDPEYMGIMAAIDAADLTLVSATGSTAGWVFEVRATDVEQLARFQQFCAEHDVPVSLSRLGRLSAVEMGGPEGLTSGQREALEIAYREGYFDEPRGADQESVAAELGISRQALSTRLRRAYRNLVETVVLQEHHDPP